jgi:molybdopterin-guanine dinucleotide biosynthesis protein A
MGKDKALIQHDGESQLARTVRLLGPVVDDVFVSARPDQADDAERSRYSLIVDRFADMGPVAGILSAMVEYPDCDWLVVACDMPGIDGRTLANLLEQRDNDHAVVAYRSAYDGLPEPLCAIYKPEARIVLEKFIARGIHCPRKMLIESDTLLLEPTSPTALDNLNTPAELEEFRTRRSRG